MNKVAFVAQQTVAVIPLVMRTLAAELRQTGHLPSHSHFGVMATLAERSRCNLSELAEQQSVSLPSMSNTVSKLVERGWVKRTQSESDRRQVLISLTPEGGAMLLALKQQAEARIETILAPLSAAEQDVLLAGLTVLRSAFHSVLAERTDSLQE